MREIKFRAWDGHNNYPSMIYSDIYNFVVQDEKSIIMQYIGLKDRNGKEIYEGDIIEYENIYNDSGAVNYNKEVIVFCEENGGWNISYDLSERLKFLNKLEVKGNIYENPELLPLTTKE